MSQYRTPTAYVLGVLVLLAVIVLTTPSGGTRARWSAAGQAEVPAMTTGRVGFEVGGTAASATVTNTSGFGVGYRPLQVSLTDTDGVPVTLPAGLRFAYRTGEHCGSGSTPARWTAVATGGSGPVAVHEQDAAPLARERPAGLCLAVSADGVPEDALRSVAGRRLQVVTRLEAADLGGGTWSTTRAWTVPYTVELPPVDPPAGEQPPPGPPATTPPARPVPADAAQCGADKSAAVLRWSWAGGPGGPAVTEWQLRVRPAGTTEAATRVLTVPDAAAREVRLTASDLLGTGHRPSQDYEVLVRAAGDTAHVDSAYAWRIKTPGSSGHLNCEGLRA